MSDSTKYILLDLADSAEPPTEFRLFRAGKNNTRKGTFVFDEDAAKSVRASAADWGVRFAIDYNHAMLSAMNATDPAKAGESAGSFRVDVREGELWATDVEWTSDASSRLREKKYRYISPAFRHDKTGRILELINVALTNIPASKHLDPLVLDAIEGASPNEARNTTQEIKPRMDAALLTALGLETGATEDVIAKRIVALAANAARAEQLASQVATLSEEVRKTRAERLSAEIEAAISDGRLAPASRAWAVKLGEQSAELLREYLSSAPKLVKMEDNGAPERKPVEQPQKIAALTDEDKHVAAMLGLKIEDVAKTRAELVSREAL